jgi:5-methylcytosine-specific restriction endonuclease McrA
MSGEAYPKSRQLARGQRRYRRKVASSKQWQRISAEKVGPCRVCGDPGRNGRMFGRIHLHHVVPRSSPWFGDDVADNIVPVCPDCHWLVTAPGSRSARLVCESLTDAEYAYAVTRCGEAFFERAYGIEYTPKGEA